jgi:hypothetical protein
MSEDQRTRAVTHLDESSVEWTVDETSNKVYSFSLGGGLDCTIYGDINRETVSLVAVEFADGYAQEIAAWFRELSYYLFANDIEARLKTGELLSNGELRADNESVPL